MLRERIETSGSESSGSDVLFFNSLKTFICLMFVTYLLNLK